MRINVGKGRRSGSVLVISMCVGVILAITLGSYLMYMRNQHALTYQSQAWNTALAIAEAGIEEGLAQANVNFGTNYNPSLVTNWANSGKGYFGPRTTQVAGGSYSAIIIPGTPGPTIISTGYTRVPHLDVPVARTVKVTTFGAPTFSLAMAALDNIAFKGNNILVDSFDSGDPNFSTPQGLYDPGRRKAGGDVASTYGMIEAGNATINGKIRIGPSVGSGFSFGANGYAGDLDWRGPGIQEGWLANDFNMDFPDVTLPNVSSWMPPLGPVEQSKYVLGTGGYAIHGDLVLNANETMLVEGNASLYVTGNIDMRGLGATASKVLITPGSSLRIYAAGASTVLAEVNTTGNASTFQYFGLPTNTSISWSGNAAYTGTVYAPSAAFTLSGSGDPKNPTDYQGACVVKTVTMNGHFKFHYDENLARIGPPLLYKVTSWAEL